MHKIIMALIFFIILSVFFFFVCVSENQHYKTLILFIQNFPIQLYSDCIIAPEAISSEAISNNHLGRVKWIWYLSPMRAAKVQASLRIHPVSPEPPLLAHTSSESRGTFRQKARSLASMSGWACVVKICHDGMLEDTNDVAQLINTMT